MYIIVSREPQTNIVSNHIHIKIKKTNLEGQQGLWQQYNNQLDRCFCLPLELLAIVAATLMHL